MSPIKKTGELTLTHLSSSDIIFSISEQRFSNCLTNTSLSPEPNINLFGSLKVPFLPTKSRICLRKVLANYLPLNTHSIECFCAEISVFLLMDSTVYEIKK